MDASSPDHMGIVIFALHKHKARKSFYFPPILDRIYVLTNLLYFRAVLGGLLRDLEHVSVHNGLGCLLLADRLFYSGIFCSSADRLTAGTIT